MKERKIYLAGSITGTSIENHSGWRDKLSETIELVTDRRVKCFNPIEHISELMPMRDWGLKYDLNMLRECDLMVVNLDYNDHSIGTNIEIGVALENKIPILIYHTQPLDMHVWHVYAAEAVFDDYENMIAYLVNHYVGEWCK